MPFRYLTFLAKLCAATFASAEPASLYYAASEDFTVFPPSQAYATSYAETKSENEKEHGLAVNTLLYFDAKARASTSFNGPNGDYRIELIAVAEEDGESLYEVLVKGSLTAKRQTPQQSEKRSPVSLDFGTHTLSNGDRLEVRFQGNTNKKIKEHAGYAWSRGRWRGLKLTPSVATPPSPSDIQHASLWSLVRHSTAASNDISILNPYGEPRTFTIENKEDGTQTIAFVVDRLGQWTLRDGGDSTVYNVDPGKFFGPLSVWSRDASVIANGDDRPVQLYGVELSNPTPLVFDREVQKRFIHAAAHSPLNFVVFNQPLLTNFNATEHPNWHSLYQQVDAFFDICGRKGIYLQLNHETLSSKILAALPPEEQQIAQDRFRSLVELHWNVFAFNRHQASDLAKLLRADHPQVHLLDLDDLDASSLYQEDSLREVSKRAQEAELLGKSGPSEAIAIGFGNYPDLTCDTNGIVHLTYAREGSLFYRTWNPNTSELSDETDTTIRYEGSNSDGPQRSDPEIAIDPKGRIHLLAGAHYAIKDGNSWHTIETNFQRDTALAIDSQGNAFICKRGGNHEGEVGIEILPALENSFQASPRDPDVGTDQGHAWSLGKDHPYGHVFTGPDSTLYLVYRQAAPDYISWRGTRDLGNTWFGGGVYGGDVWQAESPTGMSDVNGNLHVIGPTGWLFTKTPSDREFHPIGKALNCTGRDLPELAPLGGDGIAVASFGGRIAFLKKGLLQRERSLLSPDLLPIGFINLSWNYRDNALYAIFETGKDLSKEDTSGTGSIWLQKISQTN